MTLFLVKVLWNSWPTASLPPLKIPSLTSNQVEQDYLLKAVVVINASPDEIAYTLVNYNKRHLWELSCISCIALNGPGDHLQVTYRDPDGMNYTKDLKYTFSETFVNGQTVYVIHEECSGEEDSRYYELQNIPGRPGCIKVTMYAQMTQRMLKRQRKDAYMSLSSLRDFIHIEKLGGKLPITEEV